MKNEFVPYNIALAMKELGFDERCLGYYYNYKGDWRLEYEDSYDYGEYEAIIYAPLYQQAFRWFREVYFEYSVIVPDREGRWWVKDSPRRKTGEKYKTYEEAQDACLRKLIEYVQSKKKN